MTDIHKLNASKIFNKPYEDVTDYERRSAKAAMHWFSYGSNKDVKEVHGQLLHLHIKALACHCECLGMNAENMWAAIANANPVYRSEHYYQIMKKWGLSDEKGKPTI
jgi:hypothetical protein